VFVDRRGLLGYIIDMRRSEKEIKSRSEIDDIIQKATVCQLALVDAGSPYVVPVCFGYDGKCLFIHSATEGRKIEILKKNKKVSFSIYIDDKIIESKSACGWSAKYRSVIGFGKASFIPDKKHEEKKKALDIIMSHYSDKSFEYKDAIIDKVKIIKIEIKSLSGKTSEQLSS